MDRAAWYLQESFAVASVSGRKGLSILKRNRKLLASLAQKSPTDNMGKLRLVEAEIALLQRQEPEVIAASFEASID